MTMASKQFTYKCPMATCKQHVVLRIEPSDFPHCHGVEGSHHKCMDFIEDESTKVPKHVLAAYPKSNKVKPKVKGGNWL